MLLDPPVASSQSPVFGPVLGATLSASGSTNVGPADETIAGQVGNESALELGVAHVQGRVGEPVFVQIPITGTAATSLDDASVRVARFLTADGAPLPGATRVSLTRSDRSATLQLATAGAVADPTLRVEVELATPSMTVRREYGAPLDAQTAAKPAATSPGNEAAAPRSGMPEAAPAAAAPKAAAVEAPPPPEAAKPSKPAPAAKAPAPKEPSTKNQPPKTVAQKAPATVAAAPVNTPAPEPTHAPAAAKAKASEKASAAPAKPAAPDRLVVTAPENPAEAEAKHIAEMDQRVKDLTQEIVKLRGELAAQKQHETEMLAQVSQQGHPNGNWVLAIWAPSAPPWPRSCSGPAAAAKPIEHELLGSGHAPKDRG